MGSESSCFSSKLLLLVVMLASFRLVVASRGVGINCFKCVSHNGSHPYCDDPFHNNHTEDFLESPCMAGRKGRNGLFPASSCIKLTGSYVEGGGSLTIRGCALDSGTLTTDTEIIRMSHCGNFYFNDRYVRGCVQSCDDVDACNHANLNENNNHYTNLFFVLIMAILF